MQEKRNSIANALELRLSPTNTTIDHCAMIMCEISSAILNNDTIA